MSFQALPLDIIISIADYIDEQHIVDKQVEPFVKQNSLKKLIFPLLYVNSTCRLVALKKLLQQYYITFLKKNGDIVSGFRPWPYYKGKLPSAIQYVTSIEIEVDIESLVTGKILNFLANSELEGALLNNVDLNLLLANRKGKQMLYLQSSSSNIYAFFKFISEKFITAKSISIDYTVSTNISTNLNEVLMSNISKALSQTISCSLSISCYMNSFKTLLQTLTSLDLVWDNDFSQTAEIIQRYSQQLTRLHICYILFDGMDCIASGEYPLLETLVLTSKEYFTPLMRYTTEGVIFPSLQHLQLEINYPYADDTLFRNNSLKYLKLIHNDALFAMLANLKICSPIRFVEIDTHTQRGFYRDLEKTVTVPVAFIKRFSPSITRLSLDRKPYESYIINGIHKFAFARLQVLQYKQSLDLQEFIVLLKNCPQLTHLTCSSSSSEEHIINLSIAESLINEHYPLNSAFWYWKPTGKYFWAYDIQVTMMLALLCPNFGYVHLDDRYRREFNNRVDYWTEKSNLTEYIETINNIKFKEQTATAKSSESDDNMVDIGNIF